MTKKLKLFRITGDLKSLDETLEIFVKLSCVYPIESSEFIDRVHGLTSIPTDNPWESVYHEILEIESESNIVIKPNNIDSIDYSLDKIKNYIHNTHQSLYKLANVYKEGENLRKKYNDALIQVKNIATLDISLDALFSCDYMNVRFGKMPKDSLEILKLYEKKPIIYQLFNEEKNNYWLMYLTTNKHEKEIDNIFSSLYFDRIFIPDFVHGTPENAINILLNEIDVAEKNLIEIKKSNDQMISNNIEKLSDIKGKLIYLNEIYNAKKYVVDLGEKFNISGFILDKDVDLIIDCFKLVKSIEIDIMQSDFDKRLKPPRKIKKSSNRLCK
ncbi:MAG: hypothetical protein KAU02_03275 [Tenericutes bacterium]|nr:hypothetical protein [Mycoplasmatota bacterium]